MEKRAENIPVSGAAEREEVVAWAMYRALKAASPRACVSGEPEEGETVIDGSFNLLVTARLIETLLHSEGLALVAASKEE